MTVDGEAYRSHFRRLTRRLPYDYQMRVAMEIFSGRNVVVRAPTGAGKTWAVLAPFLFEGWERRPARLIYALPLRTLAQGVYKEAQNAAKEMGHPLAARVDARGRELEGPFVTLQTGEQPDDRFFDRGRIIVTTYDQVLSGLLCGPYGLSDRLHNVNAASVVGALVVFDEFHLMDPARAFLTAAAGLNLFRGLCQSVWMTATATAPLDRLLADAVEAATVPGSEEETEALLHSLPSVTTVRREIVMEPRPLSAEAVMESYYSRRSQVGAGLGRSIVLLNTVGRAQATFEALRSQLAASGEEIPLILLHSRFFAEDRRGKEARIRALFDRDAKGPAILVATQVIEAGLDISSDDLHTELCPMNALVQRAGRCARFEGEKGTVHVHPLPDTERSWLPYGSVSTEDPALARTRELLARVQHTVLHPREAAAWVQEVHAMADEAALRKGWRGQRRTCVDRILRNAIERDSVRIADLIRGDDTDSVRIIVTAGEPPTSPGDREGLSLSRWSMARLFREDSTGAGVGWWWDTSGEDGVWQPLTSVADLRRAYIACLPSLLAAYDAEVGLRLGIAGDQESPRRDEPGRPGWAPLRAESWAGHARAVAGESVRRLAREGWAATRDDPLERWEAASAAEGFRRRYSLGSGMLADAVRLCAVLHDLGKLGAGWQHWAEAAQRSKDPGYLHKIALAHTDFDPAKPEDRARERSLGVRRPPHAPASAYYARLFLGGLASVPAERRGQVASACVAAILAHHGGWWRDEFERNMPPLWPGWKGAVKDALDGVSSTIDVQTLSHHHMEDLLNLAVGPDEIEDGWPPISPGRSGYPTSGRLRRRVAMSETVFLVPSSTGTHGDVLVAAGLADLLGSIPDAGVVRIRQVEIGFVVSVPGGVDLERLPQHPGYPFLKVKPAVAVPQGAVDVVDYQSETAKADRRKQARSAAGKRRRGRVEPEIDQAIQEDAPREDWPVLKVLRSLQGHETSNRVHAAIVGRTPDGWHAEMARSLNALRDGAPSGLDWKATTVQLFTPTAAKGYSRLKPDSTDRNDKSKDRWADPLVEWLRYRGYFRVACPFFLFRGSDVRLLCPVPRDISMRALELLSRELRRGGVPGGPPKLDSLAVLRMAELLVRHSEEYHDADAEPWPGLSLAGRTPAAAISGVMVTHYQSLGQSRAVSAIATLALPGWFPIRDRSDAEMWLAILEEHQRVIRGLQDDHSDEIGLLLLYRRFLERRAEGAAWALVEFMEHYGPFVIRARERQRRVRSFRTDYFRETVKDMDTTLTEIIDDTGFRAVAAAVRRATVSAQALKAMSRSDYREIRYDLLPELRRKRSLPGLAPLMESVADFLASYNAENARRREMGKEAPRNVTTEELSAFARLVERHGTSLVGALLCAYGSCREPRAGETADDEPPAGGQKG